MISKTARFRLACFVLLMVVLMGLWLAFRRHLTLDALIVHEAWLRKVVAVRPVSAVLVSLVVFSVISMIPGLTGKAIVFGWLLGFFKGLLVVNVGLTIAALMAFLISRHLLRDLVHDKLGWFLNRLHRQLSEDNATFLLTLRLLHAPFSVVNYTLGASDVGLRRFWWTSQVGLLPGNIAFVLAGASLPSLHQLNTQGAWSVVNFPLLAGLTAAGLLPLFIRWVVHRNFPSQRHTSCS